MKCARKVVFLVIVSALIGLLALPDAQAQNCGVTAISQRRNTVIQSSCHTPTVIVKKDAYVAPAAVVVQEIPTIVPIAYPVLAVPVFSYANAPGYVPGSVQGSVLQQPAGAGGVDADKIADLVFKRLEARLKLSPDTGSVPAPTTTPESGGPPVVKQGVKGPANGSATGPVAGGDASKAVALLQSRCASCHSGAATAGGRVSLFDANKQLKALPAELKIDVYGSVYEERMPKGGTKFTDAEVETIRTWMSQR